MAAQERTPSAVGYQVPLWRAIAVFRAASLVYAAVIVAQNFEHYRHPLGGWLVLGAMACWTAVTIYAYPPPQRYLWPLLIADLAVTAACLLATLWVETKARLTQGVPPLTVTWVGGPVLAWAVAGGRRMGFAAAVVLSVCDLTVHAGGKAPYGISQATFNAPVLLLLAGVVVGHVARLAADAQLATARAAQLEAATRERERIARGIHDSVLQVLALVRRQGAQAGGEAAELGRLAGEQEAALRALIGSGVDPEPVSGETDLRALLAPLASATVSIASPAAAVKLPSDAAGQTASAVSAALDNVRRHCGEGARAWILVEDEGDCVTVTVRDEGPGIPAGRLTAAASAGRLGVAQSIRGRMRDIGGSARITSAPGEGTEVELRIPRER